MQTLATQTRHKQTAELLRKNRSVLSWVGTGFVAALTLIALTYEQTTVPTGIAARQAFERLFNPAGQNTVYDAAGAASKMTGLSRQGEVQCRLHTDRRRDRAYDYDCLATVADRSGCLRYVPFYIETSSIGPISRPVDDTLARQILDDFKRLDRTAAC